MSKSTLHPEPIATERHDDFPGNLPRIDLHQHGPRKSYWWIWLLLFFAIAYGCYELYNLEQAKKAGDAELRASMKPRVAPVVVQTVRSGNLPVYLEGLGTVTPFNTVIVRPRVDGQITAITFTEGQFVQKGQLLAQIDPSPFEVALSQAQGALAQARGTIAKDEATLRDAQANYDRYKELYSDQIIAKQQLDTQLASTDQARGVIEADKATMAAAQAQIDSAKLNLAWTKVTAPISGRIGLRQVDAGNMIHSTDANGLATIDQLQPISVLFTLPEDHLPEVMHMLQQGTKLHVDAYDRVGKQKLASGTLATVDNQIDPTTGTTRLKAVFPNDGLVLFPNQFVNARLWLGTLQNVLIVPSTAIQRGPDGTFVYVLNANGTVSTRPVSIGTTEAGQATIAGGVQSGERVVVDGAEKLTDGMKVTVSRNSGA